MSGTENTGDNINRKSDEYFKNGGGRDVTETKKTRRIEMENRFAAEFPKMEERTDAFAVQKPAGEVYFRIAEFPGCNALVIEYAEDIEWAIRGIFGEDGDLFYLDEMDTDTMFQRMLSEVEDAE